MTDNDQEIRSLATMLLKKLDVALPTIDGVIGFQSLRSGVQAYHGPTIEEEMEGLRKLLDLPKPAAHPREFYPPDYCKTCDGGGKVTGGEGLPDRMTRMNMQRTATFVKDEVAARELLLSLNVPSNEVDAKLAALPLDLENVGTREVPSVNAQTGERGMSSVPWGPPAKADLSMFDIEVRRFDWDRPPESRRKDICPDCKGDGGRGLPVYDIYTKVDE